jgi:hypothetical protein
LSIDRTRGGEVVRERFVRGEVASVDFAWKKKKKKNGRDDDDDDDDEGREEEDVVVIQRRIVAKCRQMGISPKIIMNENNNDDEWGKGLYQKLGSRIQSILSRSCSSSSYNTVVVIDDDDDKATMTNASRIVSTFESYLVSLALQSSSSSSSSNVMDNDTTDGRRTSMMGFPPLQSQNVYDVFDEILASPPRIVIRDKRWSSSSSSYINIKQHIGKKAASTSAAATTAKSVVLDMNKCGVLIPTIHFYFPTEDQEEGSSRRSSAFHRILLYAVCQFHGLETSSSVVVEANWKRDNVRKRGKRRQHDVKGSVKVVTIQGGVLLAPHTKLLDFVCT